MPSLNKLQASAILPIYNSSATLDRCLKSLLNQTVPIEIICVDDGSHDHSRDLINKYPHVTLLRQSHLGPAIARNLGARHAKSSILLFVDSDMYFDPRYVEVLIKPIKEGKTIGTYTSQEQVANWDQPLARCWNWQEGWAPKSRFPANPPKLGTDFRAILRSEFARVGGFDHTGYTDTWTLFDKLGVRPLQTPAVCYHHNPGTYQEVFMQARWAAKRPYKYGRFGSIYALLRTTFPVSLVLGIFQAIRRREPTFLPFKFIYDLGRFVGILEMLITGKLTK